MADVGQLEQRLAALEHEVAELRESIASRALKSGWLERLTGSFKDDPEFEEIVRLGEQYRQSQRPESHG